MAWQHTVYAYPILLATAVSLGLGAYAVSYGRRRGRTAAVRIFAAMNVAVAIWTGLSAVKLLSTDPVVKFHAYRLLYVGSAAVGPLLLLFALAYTDRTRWVRRRVVVGVFAVPVVFLVLLFTNPYDVVIVETWTVDVDGLVVMRSTTGPVHVAFSFTYALLMAILTLGIVVHETVRQGRSYLPQAALLGVAIATPMVVSFLTSAAVPPFTLDSVNFVPASAAVSSVALGVVTHRYRLLDLQPIAYRTAIKHSPDGVLVLDAADRIVHANDTVHSVLGRSSSVVGEPLEAVLADFDPAAESARTIERPATAGGAEFLDVRSQPLSRRGEVVGYVLVLRDVTERRRRERDLEEFTAVISHDLREPLRTTERYLGLLADGAGREFESDDAELLAVARENSERTREMVSDLLRYTRIGSAPAEFEPVDCDRVVGEVVDGLRFEIEDRDATVVVEELPTVRGVEHLLRRLFQNLLANALKHSGPAPEIRVSATRRDGEWAVSVRDDGVGIEPAELDRVFDLFVRGRGAASGSGTGMGLAICKKIVEHHDGTIGIDSSPGVGTDLVVGLPDGDRPRAE